MDTIYRAIGTYTAYDISLSTPEERRKSHGVRTWWGDYNTNDDETLKKMVKGNIESRSGFCVLDVTVDSVEEISNTYDRVPPIAGYPII